jgi:arylsulfatase A-like enzyme
MKGTTKERVVDQYLRNVASWKSDEDCFPARVFKAAARFVEGIGDQPFFAWVDSFDPHEPWYPLPPFDGLYADPAYRGPKLIDALYSTVDYMSAAELAFIRAMYAGEVTMTDKWFGYFIDVLRGRGLLDRSLVLVLSDHGHPLGDHGKIMKHPDNLYGELLRIPFLLRLPGGEGAGTRLGALVQTDDVLPTFLDYIDCGHETIAMHGRSLRPLVEGKEQAVRDYVITAYHDSPYRCVRDVQWSYFYRPEGPELYQLLDDPTERKNVIGQHRDVAQQMHRKMGVFSFTKQGKAPGKNVQERYEWSGTPIALDRNPALTRG